MATQLTRVTVWGENVHEHKSEKVGSIYPDGMHHTIAEGLRHVLGDAVTVRTATLQDDEHGLTDDVLAQTDVLTWWGHAAHGQVRDDIVERVHKRVLDGMGILVLHSGHFSKIFKKLMGTNCGLRWREAAEREILWNVNPGHPITDGIGDFIDLPHTEMYGEFFDIPQPDEQIFISWFEGGEVFRSGCTWTRGKGRVFYFRPGHETFPIYHHEQIQKVIANGVKWAHANSSVKYEGGGRQIKEPMNPIKSRHQVDDSLHKH